jgi:hypothetical protein
LAAWLGAHPGVQVICRDRSGADVEGACSGAPTAIQVADRWHLWHNLCEAVDKTIIRYRADLPEPELGPPVAATLGASPDGDSEGDREGPLMILTRERYHAVQDLLARGVSRAGIARQLRLDPHTVRRYANAATVEELLTKAGPRENLLDPFKPYLHQRWNAGVTDAATLTSEIAAQGYRGSDQTVRRYLRPFRATLVALAPRPVPPSVRQVTGWLTCHPSTLTETRPASSSGCCTAARNWLQPNPRAGPRLRRHPLQPQRPAAGRLDMQGRRRWLASDALLCRRAASPGCAPIGTRSPPG